MLPQGHPHGSLAMNALGSHITALSLRLLEASSCRRYHRVRTTVLSLPKQQGRLSPAFTCIVRIVTALA